MNGILLGIAIGVCMALCYWLGRIDGFEDARRRVRQYTPDGP